ncbi:hypothetical protein GCM10007416_22440 [Kroppenstedtia guangzhouensis]|uniref:Uncharacterized protein n=1 Tax=Kroppenstedtia guangzhouensis TaxID=1274356 RepID=A0ABQ1GRD8_9BACL|nr:hypothetical protein [Kroppenstedtia guangzhouensis]GGA48781.1 hypothetical protein GCM10007416_22440 [Kroppenstedtia guangzhouensis]
MTETNVSREISKKMAKLAESCSSYFQNSPAELAEIAAFVEAEMKGQELPGAARNRDEFVGRTFERLYPMALASDRCRQAVENMMHKQKGAPNRSPFSPREESPQYAIDSTLAEALYLTGSAVIGSILMVTSGESGGSIEQRQQEGIPNM